MKQIYALLLLCIGISTSQISSAQNDVAPNDFSSRSDLEPQLAPFYHGVASGDPLQDRVIIWTRITVSQPGAVTVDWRVGTDTTFSNTVASGTATTDDTKDYTIKVDVTGLDAGTWYYYEFAHDGRKSLIGRTRTAPASGVDELRLAIVSCQDYQNGYFNAYNEIAQRNDIDVVIHLGDYIYEYEASNSAGRPSEPANEIITLDDYRTRYSHYRLDHDLRAAHQQYPFICVYDDHETANNSWNGGAENHNTGEGDWFDRKDYALQANQEWLPVRLPDPNNNKKIFREIEFGDLINLYMIDTRLYGRDEQGVGQDSSRRMLGQEQLEWLIDRMDTSHCQWNIVGQQVMMAPLMILGQTFTTDSWDGYPRERTNFYNEIINKGIENIVVLTGDIHTSWANDLPIDNSYNNSDPNNVINSVGVEMVTPSITSQASPVPIPISFIQSSNKHIRWANLDKKGFILLDIDTNRVQGDWVFVSGINNNTYTTSVASSWYVNDKETFLRQAQSPSAAPNTYPTLAPLNPNNPVGLTTYKKEHNTVLVGVYPNPFQDEVLAQFNLFEPEELNVEVTDINGRVVYNESLGTVGTGLRYLKVNLSNLSKGTYNFSIVSKTGVVSRKLIKL